MREEVYDISGMHCAACSASVERVTRKLPGVERSDVNLVAERMTIVYDENQVMPEQIIAKVEKAGFGAKLHQDKPEAAPVSAGEDPEEAELRRKKRELIVSAIFSALLLYVSMGQMLPFGLPSLPLPDLFSMHTHPMNFAVLQLLLAIPVLYCGRNFFINGFKALFHGNPNMDSLVAIGSACSFIYSVVMTFLITDDVHGHVHNLYYESSAVVLTLVSLGKFMESRNMRKTKSAITALMRLAPDTALLADSDKVIADSAGEVGRIQQAAAELGITADIGLRVNPDFSYGTDSGAASKFGIDEAQIYAKLPEWKQLPNIRIVGIHTHLKSQELSVEVLKSYYQKMFRLAVSMREVFGILKFLNLGSGMGIPMRETEQPFDTAALGQEAQRLMTAFREKLPETRVCIETGRYVSGTAGTYAARVVDKKISYGKTFVLLNNTLNGFARPSIVAMMQHFMGDGPIAGWEPIYTGDHTVQIIPLVETRERETVTVTGNLCTGTDVVLADAELPRMEVGDVVAIPNAGAYAAVITPMQFASLKRPAQLFLRTDGTVVDTDF